MEDNQIIRIDDRLIHGQVVVGWGSILNPDYFILIDNEIACDDLEKELYLLGVPDEYKGFVFSVTEAVLTLNKFIAEKKSFIAVLKSPEIAFELHKMGLKFDTLNLGGMHNKNAKEEFNHYTYLDKSDFTYLNKLKDSNISIYIQDLPRAKRYEYSQLQEKLKEALND